MNIMFQPGKTAIVVNTSFDKTIADTYKTMLEFIKRKVGVFSQKQEDIDWFNTNS